MFGNKARRIRDLESELGQTNDLMAKWRENATKIRHILGADGGTNIVAVLEDIRGVTETPEGVNLFQWIKTLMDQHHENVTLLTGAAKVFQGTKDPVKKQTRKTSKKRTIRKK